MAVTEVAPDPVILVMKNAEMCDLWLIWILAATVDVWTQYNTSLILVRATDILKVETTWITQHDAWHLGASLGSHSQVLSQTNSPFLSPYTEKGLCGEMGSHWPLELADCLLVVKYGSYSSHFKTEKVYVFIDLQRRKIVIEIIPGKMVNTSHAWNPLLSEGPVIWFPWCVLAARNTLFSPVLGWETPHRYPEAFVVVLNYTSQKQLVLYHIWLQLWAWLNWT